MTDEAVIAAWMETPPTGDEPFSALFGGWWRVPDGTPNVTYGLCYEPAPLTLDRLWLVEERLSEEQQWDYCEAMRKLSGASQAGTWHYLHATTATRIVALAQVLRSADRGPGAGEGRG